MPTRKHKLVRTKKFQKDIDRRLTEVKVLIKEIRKFLHSYEQSTPDEIPILEEKIETLLGDLDSMTRILYRHRKYYEELLQSFEEIRERKKASLKSDKTLANGGDGNESDQIHDE